jgi:predicted HTH transcriptional regulator
MINIKSIIDSGEHFRMEAKKAEGGLPESLWESYSAFANSDGGVILLGVSEINKKLVITGVTGVTQKIQDIWNQLNNRKKISVNILSERRVYVQQVEEKEIIVIEVPRADRHDKPVYINNDLLDGAYRRNAEGDYHCTLAEVKAMLRDQSEISADSTIIDELNPNDLDAESISRYRNHFKSLKPVHIWNGLEDNDFLQKIGALRRAESGGFKPTLAGLIMFGTEDVITQILPDYFLDYREIYNAGRWSDRVVSNLGEWSGNIFDFFFKVVNKLTSDVKIPFRLRNAVERASETPVHIALREALANTVIHADYYGRRGIVIEKKRGNIMFANPGIFRPNVKEAMGGGISDPRNPTIFKMFALIDIGERAGSGLFNIQSVWKDADWAEPVLKEIYNPDRTTLTVEAEFEDVEENKDVIEYISDVTEKLGENVINEQGVEKTGLKTGLKTDSVDVLILNLIKENNNITAPEIAKQINRAISNTKARIYKLKAKGLLERIGPDKGGYWKIS